MSSYVMPEMHEYKVKGAFRFWCQKVLPAVYDDSLSYYELLCKVVDYLNTTMEDVTNLTDDVSQLYTFVDTYFSTLDVTEEINNKLDEMATDGTLYAIIQRFTQPLLDEISDNLEEFKTTTNLIDGAQNTRLSVLEGRVDEFTQLPSGSLSTEADAELVDIRTAANGVVYNNAGDSVRGQIDEVKSTLNRNYFTINLTGNGEICKIYDLKYGQPINFHWENVANVGNLDFYEFYEGGTSTRTLRVVSPTSGNYGYYPSQNVKYLRVYAMVNAGDTTTGTLSYTGVNFFADKMLYLLRNYNGDYQIHLFDRVGNGEVAKLYPVYGSYYKIAVKNCVRISSYDCYEFYTDGTNKRVQRFENPDEESFYYTPTRPDVTYLRLYVLVTDTVSRALCETTIFFISNDREASLAADIAFSKEFSAVRKFTVIGDSLASGYYKESASGTQYARNIPYSWPQIMARVYGQIAVNATRSGATCASWFEDTYGDCKAQVDADTKSQVYVMCLGTNDYKEIPDSQITDTEIGSSLDINESDYNLNADSFWGNYCKILQYVHSVAPDAKIIVCTIPQPRPDSEWKQTAIRDIASYSLFSSYVVLCDLKKWFDDLSNSRAMQSEMWQSHFTPVGYANSADFLMYALSKTVQGNLEMFVNLPQIPFDDVVTSDGIKNVITGVGSVAVDITSTSTYITVNYGKYAVYKGYVYFDVIVQFTRAVSSGINSVFTNLPTPADTRVVFNEFTVGDVEGSNNLCYTTAWRIAGPHSIGDIGRFYGRYKAAE